MSLEKLSGPMSNTHLVNAALEEANPEPVIRTVEAGTAVKGMEVGVTLVAEGHTGVGVEPIAQVVALRMQVLEDVPTHHVQAPWCRLQAKQASKPSHRYTSKVLSVSEGASGRPVPLVCKEME